MSGKQTWPELVGEPADQAVAIIQQENPGLNVVKLGENAPTTRDYRRDRVRVFCDEADRVVSEPHTG